MENFFSYKGRSWINMQKHVFPELRAQICLLGIRWHQNWHTITLWKGFVYNNICQFLHFQFYFIDHPDGRNFIKISIVTKDQLDIDMIKVVFEFTWTSLQKLTTLPCSWLKTWKNLTAVVGKFSSAPLKSLNLRKIRFR